MGTAAELTHQDGYGTPLARVDDWRMRLAGQLLLRSTGARHTHWASLIVESGAGSNELLDHRRVALRSGPDESGVPAEKSVAALNGVIKYA